MLLALIIYVHYDISYVIVIYWITLGRRYKLDQFSAVCFVQRTLVHQWDHLLWEKCVKYYVINILPSMLYKCRCTYWKKGRAKWPK